MTLFLHRILTWISVNLMLDMHDRARIAGAILMGGVAGGIIMRLRGWGGGWKNTGKPTWLVWVQSNIFNRYSLCVCMATLVCGFAYLTGHDPLWCAICFGPVAIGWLFGVIYGWGDYVDEVTVPNHEIAWIDNLVQGHLQPWLAKHYPALANSAPFIDSVSFGLRDVYYVPMFLFLIPLAHWWVLLPIAFFWQDAVVYYLCRRALSGGDETVDAEPSTGDLRTMFMLFAIALG